MAREAPDPLHVLTGFSSCLACESILRATPAYGTGLHYLTDPGPISIGELEAIVGLDWYLAQGYGIGRGIDHGYNCPPAPGKVEVEVGHAARDDAPPAREATRAPAAPGDARAPAISTSTGRDRR